METNMDISERYRHALQKVVDKLHEEFGPDLLGLLLAGSVAYGTSYTRSDLDIFVIIEPSWRQRRAIFVDSIEVDLFINPPQKIREYFADTDDSASTITMFARGRILYDPTGIMQTLAAEAKQLYEQPTPELTPQALLLLRYGLTDMLKDAQDLAETDPEAAAYQISLTLQAVLDAYYKLQRRWQPKPKHLLRDLHAHSPEIERRVRVILSAEGIPHERCERLAELVDTVLSPVGGTVHEWQTSPEVVVAQDNIAR
jgi:hypothetical protein